MNLAKELKDIKIDLFFKEFTMEKLNEKIFKNKDNYNKVKTIKEN